MLPRCKINNDTAALSTSRGEVAMINVPAYVIMRNVIMTHEIREEILQIKIIIEFVILRYQN